MSDWVGEESNGICSNYGYDGAKDVYGVRVNIYVFPARDQENKDEDKVVYVYEGMLVQVFEIDIWKWEGILRGESL